MLILYVPIRAAKVVTDHVSGFSKGFGFVKYSTIEEAESGIKGMDGQVKKLLFRWLSCLNHKLVDCQLDNLHWKSKLHSSSLCTSRTIQLSDYRLGIRRIVRSIVWRIIYLLTHKSMNPINSLQLRECFHEIYIS